MYKAGTDPHQDCHRGAGAAGKFGTRFQCDAPMALTSAVINFSKTAGAGSQFIIWTGDNARHDADPSVPRTAEDIYKANQIVANTMAQVWPNIPIIPSIGNNDVYPHDTLCTGPNQNFGNLSQIWAQWIPADQQSVFQSIGCYHVNINSNLVVLAMNTMYLYQKNKCVETKCSEGGSYEVISWLEQELKAAHHNGMRVIITGHVPPDTQFWHHKCLNRYSELASKYQNTIAGHLYGHTHQDNFLILQDPYSQEPAGVINIAPSGLSTYNPSVRLFKYDAPTATITDYLQYYSNLTADNLSGSVAFMQEYSWLNAYGYPSWTTDHWNDLANALLTNPSVYAKYLNYRYLSSGYTQFACTDEDLQKGTCVLHLDQFHSH